MKKLWMMTLTMLVAATPVMAINKVIYGSDDRKDIYQVQNTLYLDLAKATAAMIPAGKLSVNEDMLTVNGSTLENRGICSDAKFANQITSAMCSGFLVGPDLLVTAGHCIKSQTDCDSNKWVFGFNHSTSNTNSAHNVTTDQVYGCKEILEQSLDSSTKDDYALIRLEREVVGITPLTVRSEGKASEGDRLVVIGHPTGLPTKVADNAWIRNNTNDVYFSTNLDTFGGNSGSAVFNSETGVVEGILVRGEQDYVYDWSKGCRIPKECTNEGCRGEDVTRIMNIKSLQEHLN